MPHLRLSSCRSLFNEQKGQIKTAFELRGERQKKSFVPYQYQTNPSAQERETRYGDEPSLSF